MPGANSRGIPYPLDSDPIADWPDIMILLAQELAAKLPQRGSKTLPEGGSSWGGGLDWEELGTITFPVPFGSAPTVLVNVATAYGGEVIEVQAHTPTTTGCSIRAKSPGSHVPISVRWIGLSG